MDSHINKFRNDCVFYTFILQKYFQNNYTAYAVSDIMTIINKFYFELLTCISISCGYDSTFVISQNKLWACGNNDHIQLGTINNTHYSLFEKIYLENIAYVSSGRHHTITTDHMHYSLFKKIYLENIASVSSGRHHTMAITTDHKLYAWGSNSYGVLGICDRNVGMSPPAKILSDILFASCGEYHTAAVTTNYDLYTWGANFSAQLGTVSNSYHQPTKVNLAHVSNTSCGALHTMAVTTSNQLYAWGKNSDGQLGLGDTTDRHVPTIVDLPNVITVNCGHLHTMAITTSNQLYAWGRCSVGQWV